MAIAAVEATLVPAVLLADHFLSFVYGESTASASSSVSWLNTADHSCTEKEKIQ